MDIQLYNGDCLEVMSQIPDKSIDLIIADLPYQTTANSWDTLIDFKELWAQYERIIKDDRAIVLFGSGSFTYKLISSNEDLYRYKWIWYKTKRGNFVNANNRPMTAYEEIMVFSKAATANGSKNKMLYNPQGLIPKKTVRHDNGTRFGTMAGKRPSHQETTISEYTNYPCDVLEFASVGSPVHPCLPAGQKVFINSQWKKIEDVVVGDFSNYGKVVDTTSHYAEEMVKIEVGGHNIISTYNHPFLILRNNEIAWCEASQITCKDFILWNKEIQKEENSPKKVMSELDATEKQEWNTTLYGNNTMEKSQRDTKYITSMETRQTITLKICNLSLPLNTSGYTVVAKLLTENGINRVQYAESTNLVQKNIGILMENGLLGGNARSVASSTLLKSAKFSLQRVGSVNNIHEKTKVYNLTIEGVPAFDTEIGVSHNTEKPIPLIEYLIRTYSNEGDTVLDNCMGSGTAGCAAVRANRNFIGIELDPKYYEIAKNRIENEQSQLTLF